MNGNGAVILGGKAIWLRRSARQLHVQPSYLSKVLSGKRDPLTLRVGFVQKAAKLFEFASMEAFLNAVLERRAELEAGAASDSSPDTPGGASVITSHRDPSPSSSDGASDVRDLS